jgi:uncharacterized protein DUF2380
MLAALASEQSSRRRNAADMMKTRSGLKTNQRAFFRGLVGFLIIGTGSAAVHSEGASQTPIAIAVFDFELDDVTPASSLLQQTTSTAAALQKVTDAAKRALSRSGRYRVITPVSTPPQPARLQDCNGWRSGHGIEARGPAIDDRGSAQSHANRL